MVDTYFRSATSRSFLIMTVALCAAASCAAQQIEVKKRPAGEALFVNGEQLQSTPENVRIKDANVLTLPKGRTLIATWRQEGAQADEQ